DGSRVNAIVPPLAIHGSVLTIRKFSADPYTAKDLINFGTYTIDLVTVMEACVRAKLNILVSGGTGTGKTTNLNVLSSFIPDGKRVVTWLTELQGMEGDIILLQDIFRYRLQPGGERGKPTGDLVATGLRPKLVDKLIEQDIEVPAHAFKSPIPTRATSPALAG